MNKLDKQYTAPPSPPKNRITRDGNLWTALTLGLYKPDYDKEFERIKLEMKLKNERTR